ncbi:hypothetical protein VPNG_07052 [Cytospora leucostoma]|uniref:Protein kinase domain-containing protein n=1 Tax=Cytospora leucostoma TaxID=1230097 RepID=A0A423WNH9_9PEZI|nr:hypothetical protein VPNG_07052 [Cytospora leucostoma]
MGQFRVPESSQDDDSHRSNPHTAERVEAGQGETTDEATKPHTPERIEARQAAITRQTTKPHTSERVEARQAETTEEATNPAAPEHRKSEWYWAPNFRFIFKHAEGNSALRVKSLAAQEMPMEPAGVFRPHGELLVVKCLGVLQILSEVKCILGVKSIQCHFYYAPNSGDIILYNTSKHRLRVVSSSGSMEWVAPYRVTTLSPGLWKLSSLNDAVDLETLPRNYFLKVEETTSTAARRPADDADLCASTTKKAKTPAGGTVARTARADAPSPETRSEAPTTVWTGVDLHENQLVKVSNTLDTTEYSIRRLTNWARKVSNTEVFTASLDDGKSNPEAVLVKIIRVRDGEDGKAIIWAADAWWNEFDTHRRLHHPYIAGLRGWDARMLSLYIEYKQSKDLGNSYWRDDNAMFRGSTTDVYCILAHMSSALKYLNEKGIAHNDIKPGNILYTTNTWPATGHYLSTPAGAILIDFGLATLAGRWHDCYNGTPWYVAPEVRNMGERGPPADVFALGVVMLYVMKRIPLPEIWGKYPPWNIGKLRSKDVTSFRAMNRWQNEVRSQVEGLAVPRSQEEAGLCGLVRRMLADDPEQRISSSDLAEATKEWATIPHMSGEAS